VLGRDSRIKETCLYDRSGDLIAVYPKDRPFRCPSSSFSATPPSIARRYRFTLTELLVMNPISGSADGQPGAIFFRVGLAEMYGQMLGDTAIGILVLCFTTLLVGRLSSRLHRLISNPIQYLTQVAGRVLKDGDYAIRAIQWSEDEMGLLVSQFNRMMEQIDQRDRELQSIRDQLESRVEERTRDLQIEIAERKSIEQELRVATLSAEEANRSKSEFLANMSHELRTPLNAVLGYSEMLEEDAEASGLFAMVQDLRHIQSAGRKLLTLINDILDLSKIEAGCCDLHLEHVPVASVVQEVLDVIQPLARRNRNQFVLAVEAGLPPIYVDALKFHQCLLNLLSNACKFTQGGVVTLAVSAAPSSEASPSTIWQVRDTGIGIALEDRAKLFQAFSQVDGSATRKHDGTGLGLAISRQLCQLMGGAITVESEPGQGSVFSIRLPSAA
jgi:signal transduction histidine kinase